MATTIQTIELPKKARALDTSGNNNHGQIYSGRGLEFDGVSDDLTLPSEMVFDGEFTVSAWIYPTGTGTDHAIIGSGSHTDVIRTQMTTQRIDVRMNGTSNIFHFTGILNASVWYRMVITRDSSNNIRVFLNGVESVTGAIVDADDLLVEHIGKGYSTWVYSGSISDLQLWDTAWTQTDITYDYLNPESLVLNGGGTALTESNLKLWYPMQDGHRGQQSYILDGANTGLGDELITNGDFENGETDWDFGGDWTLTNGTAEILTSTNSFLIQSVVPLTVKTYKVQYEVVSTNGSNFRFAGGNSCFGTVTLDSATVGVKTVYVQSNGTKSSIQFNQNAFRGSIDNVSVKAINAKNHATTVFYGDTLWDTAASTNGNVDNWQVFGDNTVATDTKTVKGTYVDAASGIYIYLRDSKDLSSDLTVGRTYQLQYDIKVNSGSVSPAITVSGGTTVTGDAVTSTTFVTKTIDFTCEHATDHYFWTGNMSEEEIVFLDNFSLKEVGVASGWTDADQQLHIPQTALQSYNELAWFQDNGGASNPHASASNHNDFNPEDGDFTISAWVYQADLHGNNYFFAQGGGGASGWNTQIDSSGNPRFTIEDDDGSNNGTQLVTDGSTAIPTGEFFHFVGVINRTTDYIHVYINGVEQDSTDISSINNPIEHSSGVLKFGSWAAGYTNGVMNGTATEFSIFKGVAFSQAEINELYNDGKALDATTHSRVANLKGYWRNNGLSTWTNINNPGTHDATLTNATETILIPQGVDSTRDNQGFIMNRQKDTSSLNLTTRPSDYVEAPADGSLDFGTGDFSIECWVQYGFINNSVLGLTGSSLNVILSNGIASNSSVDGFNLLVNSADFVVRIGDGTDNRPNNSYTIPGTPVVGNWYHVVITRASTVIETYIDGDDVGGATHADWAVNVSTDDSLLIGNDKGGHRDYKWPIDNVRIYSKALSSTEVLRNYNATKGSHRN